MRLRFEGRSLWGFGFRVRGGGSGFGVTWSRRPSLTSAAPPPPRRWRPACKFGVLIQLKPSPSFPKSHPFLRTPHRPLAVWRQPAGLRFESDGARHMESTVWLSLRVWGSGFGVWGQGFGIWGLGFGTWGLELGVNCVGLGVRINLTGFVRGVPASASERGEREKTKNEPLELKRVSWCTFRAQGTGFGVWGAGYGAEELPESAGS